MVSAAAARRRASWIACALLLAGLSVAHCQPLGTAQDAGGRQGTETAAVQAPTVHLQWQPGQHVPAPKPGPHAGGTVPQQPADRGSGQAQQVPHQRVPLSAVVVMSSLMSAMSCLGVLPYFFCSALSKPWAGLANAVASGVMLSASFGLLAEGAPYGGTYLIAGMLLGVLFVKLSQEHLEQYEVDGFEQLAGADARKVILFLAVMAVHAVGEGGGVGVSFAGDRGWAQGTLVTLAIGLHNVPEAMATATVLVAKGTPPRRALLWTVLTALPQSLVAPPAYVFVDTFRALLPLALGFAAGCMIWVVLAELLPDALEAVEPERVATCATGSAAWLQGLSIFIGQLETPAGTLSSPFGDYQAVLPLGMGRLLLQLLPVFVVPGLAAGLTMRAQWSRPVAVAASAGLLLSHATFAWLQLLLAGSGNRLLCAVALPLAGALVAAGLWSHLRQGWRAAAATGTRHVDVPADTCYSNGLLCKASCTPAGECQHHLSPPHPGGYCSSQLVGLPRPASSAVVTAPAAAHLGAEQAHSRHSRGGSAWGEAAPAAGAHQQQQQQQHRQGGPPGHSSSFGGWLPQPPGGPPQQRLQQQLAAGGAYCSSPTVAAGGAAAWDSSSHASSCCSCSGGDCSPGHCERGGKSHSSSPLLQPGASVSLAGSGDFLLPVTAAAAGSSRAVAGACYMALAGAAGSGVPLGLQLAGALAAAPDHTSHALAPTLLLGCMFAVACAGLLLPLLGHSRLRTCAAAAAVASMPALVAVATLLTQPGWVGQGRAFAAADSLQGLLAGFNAFVLLVLVLPMGRSWSARKASLGLMSGATASLLLCACLLLMCISTPYCLQPRLLLA